MTDPINIADEYEKRERAKLNARLALMKPLPEETQSLIDRLTAAAPYYILFYGPEILTKAEKYLRENDITFPLMGTLFNGLKWGLNLLRKRCGIK